MQLANGGGAAGVLWCVVVKLRCMCGGASANGTSGAASL